jgi:hypothetical protein
MGRKPSALVCRLVQAGAREKGFIGLTYSCHKFGTECKWYFENCISALGKCRMVKEVKGLWNVRFEILKAGSPKFSVFWFLTS